MPDNNNYSLSIQPIAVIHSPFPEKFGIPRQSGLADNLAEIHFMPAYRNVDAVRGLEGFDYLWLIWCFSKNIHPEKGEDFHPTVRPPRLGGNTRMGVFATRSSFRPNGLALSSVKIVEIDLECPGAPVITVSGADLMDGTPIYDIKPYLPYADAHPEARGGFTDAYSNGEYRLEVQIMDSFWRAVREMDKKKPGTEATIHKLLPQILSVLSEDPRPSYQKDPNRIYGMSYGDYNFRFTVDEKVLYLREMA